MDWFVAEMEWFAGAALLVTLERAKAYHRGTEAQRRSRREGVGVESMRSNKDYTTSSLLSSLCSPCPPW
jgi:hypothetical protein